MAYVNIFIIFYFFIKIFFHAYAMESEKTNWINKKETFSHWLQLLPLELQKICKNAKYSQDEVDCEGIRMSLLAAAKGTAKEDIHLHNSCPRYYPNMPPDTCCNHMQILIPRVAALCAHHAFTSEESEIQIKEVIKTRHTLYQIYQEYRENINKCNAKGDDYCAWQVRHHYNNFLNIFDKI